MKRLVGDWFGEGMMHTTVRHGRKAVAFAILCAGGFGAFGLHGRAQAAADADVFVIRGTLNLQTAMPTGPVGVDYSVASDVQCSPTALGVVTVPGFIDVAGTESGECGGVTGNGTLTLAECSTGLITADWQLPEPTSGTDAEFSGGGVVVGGVAIMTGPSPWGSGYSDDSATGPGAVIATVATPSNESCGSNNHMKLTAVVAGAY